MWCSATAAFPAIVCFDKCAAAKIKKKKVSQQWAVFWGPSGTGEPPRHTAFAVRCSDGWLAREKDFIPKAVLLCNQHDPHISALVPYCILSRHRALLLSIASLFFILCQGIWARRPINKSPHRYSNNESGKASPVIVGYRSFTRTFYLLFRSLAITHTRTTTNSTRKKFDIPYNRGSQKERKKGKKGKSKRKTRNRAAHAHAWVVASRSKGHRYIYQPRAMLYRTVTERYGTAQQRRACVGVRCREEGDRRLCFKVDANNF